ncbi:MAG: ABC transporter ATP-binding protein, partial [Bdellovibrio sp.]
DEVAVMNKGKVVEQASALEIYENPQDDYTKKLLDAIPKGVPKELLQKRSKAQSIHI